MTNPAKELIGPWADQRYIYALVCERGNREFVVKIGISHTPAERYASLATALPDKSVMLFAPVPGRKMVYTVERLAHSCFRERRMEGEWFHFTLDEKQIFHTVMRKVYESQTRFTLRWRQMTPKQARRIVEHARSRDWKQTSRAPEQVAN